MPRYTEISVVTSSRKSAFSVGVIWKCAVSASESELLCEGQITDHVLNKCIPK